MQSIHRPVTSEKIFIGKKNNYARLVRRFHSKRSLDKNKIIKISDNNEILVSDFKIILTRIQLEQGDARSEFFIQKIATYWRANIVAGRTPFPSDVDRRILFKKSPTSVLSQKI